MSKPKVLISIPNGTAWIHKHCFFALLKMMQDDRVQSNVILPTHSPYVNNLHLIMKDFLEGDYDYWITFDDDNPPRQNVIDLVFLDLDLVGCPTPVWHNAVSGDWPVYWNALDAVDDGWKPHQETKGLQKVDALGSGCLVISRRVLEKLKDNKPFMRVWNPDGTVEIGGDYSFCRKVKAAGFSIWAHYDYPCYHFNEIELGEVVTAFIDAYKKPPNT